MEALGGYASSGSSEEEEEMATAAAAAGVPQSNAAALEAEAARAERVAAMEKSDSDESEDSDESDSSDDSDDDEREAQEAGFRRGASKAAAVSLPSASELMAGGGALCDTRWGSTTTLCTHCVFFSLLAQAMEGRASTTTRMSSRRSTQSESWATTRTTPFSRRFRARKRSTAKDQSPRPIPQSHALGKRRWPHLHPPALPLSAALRRTSGVGGALLPPQVARGRANTVTEDTSAWNVTKKKVWTCSLRQTSPRTEPAPPAFQPLSHAHATHTHTHTPRCALTPAAVSCW